MVQIPSKVGWLGCKTAKDRKEYVYASVQQQGSILVYVYNSSFIHQTATTTPHPQLPYSLPTQKKPTVIYPCRNYDNFLLASLSDYSSVACYDKTISRNHAWRYIQKRLNMKNSFLVVYTSAISFMNGYGSLRKEIKMIGPENCLIYEEVILVDCYTLKER